MNVHEYQAKSILSGVGIPVASGVLVKSLEEALIAYDQLDTQDVVAKAQVHAGGRGKAGGVKLVHNKEELAQFVEKIIHTNLITYQTDSDGQPVDCILLEPATKIAKEFYLSAVIDRSSKRLVVMASSEGGTEIEQVAAKTPNKIQTVMVDPVFGILPYQCRKLAKILSLEAEQYKQFQTLVISLVNLFETRDLSLVEINPLVLTTDNKLLCLDAKINIDDNALYRQPELRLLRDPKQENAREAKAREWDINYISLDGDIGCMVNGAGLAMATMDLIKLYGGMPANFLDVGGGATTDRVTQAFKIILSDKNVKAVLVNIFGGIVRCDLIADGIIAAVREVGVKVPVIVRLEGNRRQEGADLLAASGLNIIAVTSWLDAAKNAVAAAGGKK